MSLADRTRAIYRAQIGRVGQWIAIRRYTGTGPGRTGVDTLARASVRYGDAKELVGSAVQFDVTAISLVDTLSATLPVTVKDTLMLGFDGYDVPGTAPTLVGGRVVNGKEAVISNPKKRTVSGTLIALEIHATGPG